MKTELLRARNKMTIPDHFVIAQGSGGDPHAPRQNRAPKASAFASAFEQAIHGLQERSQNFILLRALRYLAVLGWLFWASYGIAQERSLKVGAVLALSGYAAKHSEGIRKGIELAAEKLKGDGWSLDINFQDDQTNPAKSVSAVKFLLSQGYDLFIGPTWSFQVSAARPSISQADAVALIPAGSSDIGGGSGPGIFYLSAPRLLQTGLVAKWLKENGFKRVMIITPQGDWGEVHKKVFNSAVSEIGGETVLTEEFEYGTDLSTLKTLLIKAKSRKVDVILSTGASGDTANFLKARKEIELEAAFLSTDTVWDAISQKLIAKGDHLLKNCFVIGIPVSSKPDFVAAYTKAYGESPLVYSDKGYDALILLAHASQASDGTAKGIREYLSTMEPLAGISGPLSFDQAGDIRQESFIIVAAEQHLGL